MKVRTEEERLKYNEYMRNYQKAHYTYGGKGCFYRLTDDDKEYIRIHSVPGTQEKLSAREIAEYLGCHPSAVQYHRCKMGLKIQRNGILLEH